MKFHISVGIWSIRGEQLLAIELYNVNLNSSIKIVQNYYVVSSNNCDDGNENKIKLVPRT